MPAVPENARWIGYLGAIPFLVFSLSFVAGGPLFPGFALQGFMVYSGLVLAFLGGIRWGAAMNLQKFATREFLLSMVPVLLALCALLVDPRWGVLILGASYLAAWLFGLVAEPPAAPPWYPILRTQLTVPALICHASLAYGLYF
ncbi:MAG: DUF3429 domain-containing protein [Xanthomonadales bacterium]|nr:DUF3429 domain-containing protein [Xanthomonadales bacterium]